MTHQPLYPFQEQLLADLRCLLAGMGEPRRALMVAETGAGKSVVARTLVRLSYQKGKRSLFVARGRLLVEQFSGHLQREGVPHGVLMAGHCPASAPVQVASKDTLESWTKRGMLALPDVDLLVIDEAHESAGGKYRDLIARYPEAAVVGLTATPARTDGKSLGPPLYRGMVCAPPSSELVRMGFLCPTVVYAPDVPDLKRVRRSGRDYSGPDLARKMDTPKLVGSVVGHYLELARGRQALAWGSSVGHSVHVRDELRRAGVSAEHVDGTTPPQERERIESAFRAGSFEVLCNYDVYSQGADFPFVSCGIMARPTLSFLKARQMWGRLKRTHPGKADAVVLDHAGLVFRHGMPDDDVSWELDFTGTVEEKVARERRKARKEGKDPVACPRCYMVFLRRGTCPNCGYHMGRRAQAAEVKPGKLVQVSLFGGKAEPTREELRRYWMQCLGVCARTGRKAGAAAHMYRQRYGKFPSREDGCEPMPARSQWQQRVGDLYPGFLLPPALHTGKERA